MNKVNISKRVLFYTAAFPTTNLLAAVRNLDITSFFHTSIIFTDDDAAAGYF